MGIRMRILMGICKGTDMQNGFMGKDWDSAYCTSILPGTRRRMVMIRASTLPQHFFHVTSSSHLHYF